MLICMKYQSTQEKKKNKHESVFSTPWQLWSCSWASFFQKSEPSPSTHWAYRLCRPGPHQWLPSLHPLKKKISSVAVLFLIYLSFNTLYFFQTCFYTAHVMLSKHCEEQQFNSNQNSNTNTMILAKMSIAASPLEPCAYCTWIVQCVFYVHILLHKQLVFSLSESSLYKATSWITELYCYVLWTLGWHYTSSLDTFSSDFFFILHWSVWLL